VLFLVGCGNNLLFWFVFCNPPPPLHRMVPIPTVSYGSDSYDLLNYGSGTNAGTYPLLKDGDALVFEWFAELHDLLMG
jgi:hypothetical protein